MSENAAPEPVPQAKLPPIGQLFKESFALYKRRASTLWLLILRAILVFLLLSIVLGIALALTILALPEAKAVIVPVGTLAIMAFVFYLIIRYALAMIYAAEGEARTVGESIELAKPGVVAYLGTMLLASFLVVGGFFFFVIPGIVMAVWLFNVPFVFAIEGKGGMSALLRSKALVKGRWWSVFGRMLSFSLVMFLINLVPVLGTIVGVLLLPYGTVYNLVLYRHLTTERAETPDGSKKALLFFGLFGFLAIPVIAITFGAVIAGAAKLLPLERLRPPAASAQKFTSMTQSTIPEPEERAKDGWTPTHEIILRNGHYMTAKVLKESPEGVMVETSPGAQTFFATDEIAQIAALKKTES